MIRRPLAIRTELKIMHAYMDICIYYLTNRLEKETTLRDDLNYLEGLTPGDGFGYNKRFATIYRSERKKIMHN